MTGALSVIALAVPMYLTIGAVLTCTVQWRVQRGCPLPVLLWVVASCVVVLPYVCVRHVRAPWKLIMEVNRR